MDSSLLELQTIFGDTWRYAKSWSVNPEYDSTCRLCRHQCILQRRSTWFWIDVDIRKGSPSNILLTSFVCAILHNFSLDIFMFLRIVFKDANIQQMFASRYCSFVIEVGQFAFVKVIYRCVGSIAGVSRLYPKLGSSRYARCQLGQAENYCLKTIV